MRGICLVEIIWKLCTKIINDQLLGNVKIHDAPTRMHPRTRYGHDSDRNQTSESGRNDEIGLAAGKDVYNSLEHASFCNETSKQAQNHVGTEQKGRASQCGSQQTRDR
jgi:hypothetical protein